MRIRKRTPVRAASPGPSPPSPPPPQKERPPGVQGEEEEEDKRGSLVVGGREEDDLVLVASKNRCARDSHKPHLCSAVCLLQFELKIPPFPCSCSLPSRTDAPKPPDAGDSGRCSRNDGKRWRCKCTAVPGYVFCERHIAWSTRKRKPSRPKKKSQSSILDPPAKEEPAAAAAVAEDDDNDDVEEEEAKNQVANLRCNGDGFYYDGGLQQGGSKRAKSSGAGPA
ncbi:hypothetical protein E2562_011888 [Oryza meyeriana var. granulata]|uniref:WRC domain-containing protein n=1 Tax=Oryza meyeriana var. granulata TaxID=110450 RepID=A0A6G1CF79_9ORYZ|nr:hypothetical protein E2562_011888 [Oryza meyeriana var. granulata]